MTDDWLRSEYGRHTVVDIDTTCEVAKLRDAHARIADELGEIHQELIVTKRRGEEWKWLAVVFAVAFTAIALLALVLAAR